MQTPFIHINGTGRRALVDLYCEAGSAVHKALRKLSDAAPNQRDYYPLGDAAWLAARAEHDSRMVRLRTVLDELQALAEHCADEDDCVPNLSGAD